jgi:hypothetical protein
MGLDADSLGIDADRSEFLLQFVTVNADEENLQNVLGAFPNPASDKICIPLQEINDASAELVIENSFGQKIYSTTCSGKKKVEVNVEDFQNGIYFFRAGSGLNMSTRKFMVVH